MAIYKDERGYYTKAEGGKRKRRLVELEDLVVTVPGYSTRWTSYRQEEDLRIRQRNILSDKMMEAIDAMRKGTKYEYYFEEVYHHLSPGGGREVLKVYRTKSPVRSKKKRK